ncbi:MAG: ABC transporter ATP-binding protein [Spirochaetaceae bacterium]|jgi:energy-coupling factor transport system ATP-binding protein|nr:ABC transporter ATP-binding protein [Spirochaetaceae bacterium]
MPSAISFKDFTFQYRSQTEPTLYDINLEIKQGEKILITGTSGCGKSTLIHCINGLIPNAYPGKSSGEFLLMGQPTKDLSLFDFSKIAGTVLQDTDGQFVGLTAAEDIAFAAENDCMPVDTMHDEVLKAAKLVQIDEFIGQSPQNLSGGQTQRVSMAGVLIDNVDILLFDEPLANLDPAAGKQAVEIIDLLHNNDTLDRPKTILIVEHRLEDVLYREVDRIILMENGRIKADMPPDEILSTKLLRETGVREPLYLSALRYAGISWQPEDKPASVETLRFDTAALRAWDAGVEEIDVQAEKTPLLQVENLYYSYEEELTQRRKDAKKKPSLGAFAPLREIFYALQDISFSINKGERVAIAGKNGAGKSTLASLICGFLKPDSGSISFNENNVMNDFGKYSIKERAERIGFVMQNPNHMLSFPKIFDECAYGLRTRGIAENEIKDRVWDILKICGLYPFRSWPVAALSFGQKKRLTIASILVLGTKILILDEPTAGQDWRHYTEIMEFLNNLTAKHANHANRIEDLTMIMITHDMHLMLEYTDRALVLTDGHLLADDKPAVVLSDEAIINGASLKRTSLYDLAEKAGIADKPAFIRRFIQTEKRQRAEV